MIGGWTTNHPSSASDLRALAGALPLCVQDAAVGDIPIGELVEPAEIAELVVFALREAQRSLNG